MIRFLSCAVLMFVIVGAFRAQPPPQSDPWNVTMKTNTVADSNLVVVNRCKQTHQFQIQIAELPFLRFSSTQLTVKGGSKQLVPVKFDTKNLAPGVYRGTVSVVCLSCKAEATCAQDREALPVILRVADGPTTTGQPSGAPTSPNQPTSPTTNQPGPQTTGPGQTIPVGLTAAELKKRCDDLQRQLNEAKRPCERKEKECAELERKLAELDAAAKKAQQDFDQKKKDFDDAMQNLLNSMIAAAKARGYQVKLSLTRPEPMKGEKWVALELAKGVVVYFDAGGIEQQIHIDNLASALRALANSGVVRQLKQQAALLAEADAKNKAAQAALAQARLAYDKCKEERDALCPKAKQLQEELDKCRKDAEAAAAEEARRKADADAAATAEAARKTAEEKQEKLKAAAQKAAEKEAADKAAAEAARQLERLKRKTLCTTCLKFLLQQQTDGAQLSDQSKQALQALSDALDKLNDTFDKAGKASDILPGALQEQLEKVSDALGKIAELRDLANQLKGIIAKLNQLATGGNDPSQFAVVLQLTADVLGAVAERIPILGPLATYFKLLADAGDAIINGLPNAIGAEAARKWGSMIDVWNCHAYANFLQAYNGDLQRVYEKVFSAAERGIIARTPRAEEKLKEALLAKLKKCCIEWITKECKRD